MSNSSIRVSHKRTPIWERLVEEHGVFDKYTELFVFAACVGYYNERYAVDYGGDSEMLWMHVGNRDLFKAVSAAIAYQHTGNPEALVKPSMQLEIMAQYAVGGAEVLEEEFGSVKGDPTDAILNYIQEQHDPDREATQQTELDKILSAFENDMMESEAD